MTDTAGWITGLRMRALSLWGKGRLSPGAAVEHLVAMQAQEHGYARWSVAQRVGGNMTASDVDAAFDEGRILRTHVLRPTWHFVAPSDLRWLLALSGPRVKTLVARRLRELALDPKTLTRALDVVAHAVADEPRTRHELRAELERRGIACGGQRLPHILMYAELSQAVCSGPVRQKQHTYAAFDRRVPLGNTSPTGEEALAELAHRYFATRGPATTGDFSWWSGLTLRDARRGLELAAEHLVSHTVDGRAYWFAEGADGRGARSPARVDPVQCFDEVIISYRESRDVLQSPPVTFRLLERVDGFVHVLLRRGRLLGHWRVRKSRGAIDLETRIDVRLSRDDKLALDAALDRYRRFAVG